VKRAEQNLHAVAAVVKITAIAEKSYLHMLTGQTFTTVAWSRVGAKWNKNTGEVIVSMKYVLLLHFSPVCCVLAS